MSNPLISFVIPCYGSEHTISFVTKEIRDKISEKPEYDYEIIAVNDCSPDRVWDVLLELAKEDPKLRLIGLAKNMNRPGAVMAGMGKAAGDYVVIMDDDGQCPMERFWDLLAPLEGEYDVSMAGYPSRKQSAFKNFGTFVNKKMTEYMLDRPKDLEFTNFMVMRRYVAEELCKYVLAIPTVLMLFLRLGKEERILRLSFILLTVMLCLPIVGYVMSGFTTFSNRWCFAYALCVAMIITIEAPQFVSEKSWRINMACIGSLVYAVVCVLVVKETGYRSLYGLLLMLIGLMAIGNGPCSVGRVHEWHSRR